ncbi:MAG: hypothetical protein ACREN7_09165 [Candidatus Dormibacteria bacterium]
MDQAAVARAEQLRRRVCARYGLISAEQAKLVGDIAELVEGELYAADGTDAISWVMATRSVAYPQAAAKLALPETDAFFTTTAETAPAKELLRAVKNKESPGAPESLPRPPPGAAREPDIGWLVPLQRLPGPDDGAKLMAALEAEARHDDHPDAETGTWDPAGPGRPRRCWRWRPPSWRPSTPTGPA